MAICFSPNWRVLSAVFVLLWLLACAQAPVMAQEPVAKASEDVSSAQMRAENLHRERQAALNRFLYEDVYFEEGRYRLSETSKALLEQKLVWLNAHPDAVVIVEGHCDELGSHLGNLRFGELRAGAVMSYLVRHGIAAGRLAPVSYGEERPVDMGHSSEARAKNRRVHFALQQPVPR